MTRLVCIALLMLWTAAAWGGPCAVNVPLLPSAPVIDGDLSDEAWQQAGVVRGFVAARQGKPEAASPLTTMRVGHTREALYLAFECAEPNLERLVAAQPERDYAMNLADSVSLYLDLGEAWDAERYIEIAHDCTEVYHDSYARDHDWDGAWLCKTGRTPEAWTAEFCLPFTDLRARLAPGDAWWMSVERNRLAGGRTEAQSWCPAPGGVRTPTAAGRLVFGSYGDNVRAAGEHLAGRIDEDLPLLRAEAAMTEEGSRALGEIEAIRERVGALSALPSGAPLTVDDWQAQRGEIEQAQRRFRELYWTIRFAALLAG